MAFIIYTLLCTATFYLASRAMITSWAWSRYPTWLAKLTDCCACLSFWTGGIFAATLGRHYDLPYLGLAARDPITIVVAALCSMVLAPMAAALMISGLDRLGNTVVTDGEA